MSKDLEEVKDQATWYLGEDHFWRKEQKQKGAEVRLCITGLKNIRRPVWTCEMSNEE